jgi:hypothetical protein
MVGHSNLHEKSLILRQSFDGTRQRQDPLGPGQLALAVGTQTNLLYCAPEAPPVTT